MHISGPPEIKRADNVVVIHNVSTLLTCEVLAHPPATISWHLGNITFSENSTEDGGPRVLNNGSLYIPRPSRKDAGNYSCRAQNKNAAVSQNIELRVGGAYIGASLFIQLFFLFLHSMFIGGHSEGR